MLDPASLIRQMDRSTAVGQIRYAVLDHAGWCCVHCGQPVNMETSELDEKQSRGQCDQQSDGEFQSGEVSVENCQILCRKCHTGLGGKHDRAPSFLGAPNATLQT